MRKLCCIAATISLSSHMAGVLYEELGTENVVVSKIFIQSTMLWMTLHRVFGHKQLYIAIAECQSIQVQRESTYTCIIL